jgi:UDP-N-acetylglucosamine 2-epimerase
MKILFCLGTRPEWLKIKPLINLMDKSEYDLFFTGQHEDLLNNVEFDYKVSVTNKNNRLDDIMISCMSNFPNKNYDYVLVQGDTGSALGCALASYNRKIKLIHLEAGLRTYDLENPYPEEAYRQIISRISDINLCPTNLSFENLISEKVTGKIFVVGNTVLDNIVDLKDKTNYGNDVLITLHRRENHDIMDKWIESLNKITEK